MQEEVSKQAGRSVPGHLGSSATDCRMCLLCSHLKQFACNELQASTPPWDATRGCCSACPCVYTHQHAAYIPPIRHWHQASDNVSAHTHSSSNAKGWSQRFAIGELQHCTADMGCNATSLLADAAQHATRHMHSLYGHAKMSLSKG